MTKLTFAIRRFASDTLPGVFISIGGGIVNEFFIAQMNFKQILISRLISLVVTFTTSWVYAETRDTFLNLFRYSEKEGKNFKYWVINTSCSMYFGGSLYLIILAISGVDQEQAKIALGNVLLVKAFVGYPYGIILDLSRKFFKADKKR